MYLTEGLISYVFYKSPGIKAEQNYFILLMVRNLTNVW